MSLLRFFPIVCVGKKRGVGFEVLRRKGLQGLQYSVCFWRKSGLEVVAQLRHQHRWRHGLVVGASAPLPADVELLARRQKSFQEQIAIVFSP